MTTFGTQRLNPDIAKAEERLTEILTGLGKLVKVYAFY